MKYLKKKSVNNNILFLKLNGVSINQYIEFGLLNFLFKHGLKYFYFIT